jgi:hypothetical protein
VIIEFSVSFAGVSLSDYERTTVNFTSYYYHRIDLSITRGMERDIFSPYSIPRRKQMLLPAITHTHAITLV